MIRVDPTFVMASKRESKRRRVLAEPPSLVLKKLLEQLQAWIDDGERQVIEFRSPKEAAVVVTKSTATYQDSLNGWWEWYSRCKGIEETIDSSLREELAADAVEVAMNNGTTTEVQLGKLPRLQESLPHPDIIELLKKLQPRGTEKRTISEAKTLAKDLWPLVEHDNGRGAEFAYTWIDSETGRTYRDVGGKGEVGLANLLWNLWSLASQQIRAVTLSIRVRKGGALHEVCQALDKSYEMTRTICPPSHWCLGPPHQEVPNVTSDATEVVRANRLPRRPDERYYVIIGSPGALTKSHWDRGVQAVLYHTVAGTNHAIAVPRSVAQMLQAVDDATNEAMSKYQEMGAKTLSAWVNGLELKSLQACDDAIKAGTFHEGETMLILPGGGHAVLTGDQGKVVLAGEWHQRTDVET